MNCHWTLTQEGYLASAAAPSAVSANEDSERPPTRSESHLDNPLGVPSFAISKADEHGWSTAHRGGPFCRQQDLGRPSGPCGGSTQ